MKFFLPRIKSHSSNRANAQAVATGQIVDTISNISIVKLFANSKYEDNAALAAFGNLKKSLQEYGKRTCPFSIQHGYFCKFNFSFCISSLFISLVENAISPGAVVAAGSVALRIMMMAGWVSFSL